MRRFLFALFCFCAIAGIGNSCQSEGESSDRRGESKETKGESTPVEGTDTIPCVKPKVNVYIENSGSMDGFVNGITEFKDVIGNLLVNLKYFYDEDNIQIYFIRNEKAKIGQDEELVIKKACESDIADFARAIDLSWKNDCKNRGQNTNLNNIFKTILDSTQNNTLSILVSDCIYSIGDGSTVNLLNQEKNTTYDAFLTKFKRSNDHLATMIVKLTSEFDGRYFPYTGDRNNFYFKGELPYYICVISNQKLMKQFNENITLKQNADGGFKNKYIISNEKSDSIYYSILLSTDNEGRFKPQRKYSSLSYVHGIEDIDVAGRGSGCSRRNAENRPHNLQFAVAVDLSGIDVDESYLLDPDNYSLSDGNFTVEKIVPIEKNETKSGDWVRISKASKIPSHKIILRATGTAYSDLTISLKKQMPSWIRESSIMDDTRAEKIMGGNSFGLQFWVEGIAEAYEKAYKDNKSYFDIDIKIKR